MIDAKEAHRSTAVKLDSLIKEQLAQIEAIIYDAINHGRYETTYSAAEHMSTKVAAFLIALGYDVRIERDYYNDPLLRIKWEDSK